MYLGLGQNSTWSGLQQIKSVYKWGRERGWELHAGMCICVSCMWVCACVRLYVGVCMCECREEPEASIS